MAPDESAPSPPSAQSVQGVSRRLVRSLSSALIIAALVYGALLLYADAGDLVASIQSISADALWTATLLAIGNYVVRFVRWAYYLRVLGIRVGLGQSALVFLAGFAMSITPAKMGEVLKSLMLRESHDVAIARSAPIIVAERFTDVAALLLLGGFGLLDLPGGSLIAGLAVLTVFAGGLLVGSRTLGEWLIRQMARLRPLARFRDKLLQAHGSIRELLSPFAFVVAMVLSVVAWGLQGLALAAIAEGLPGVSLSLSESMLAYCAPLLTGTLAMLPGGLGLTEASMTGVLVRFGNATPADAAAITVIVRVVTFWLAIALGFLALLVWNLDRTRGRARVAVQPDGSAPTDAHG